MTLTRPANGILKDEKSTDFINAADFINVLPRQPYSYVARVAIATAGYQRSFQVHAFCVGQISWGTFRGSFYVRTFDAHNAPRSPLATKGKKAKKKIAPAAQTKKILDNLNDPKSADQRPAMLYPPGGIA